MDLNAQSPHLDSTLLKISKEYLPERAYLHYDKSSYLPGETIWYKAYIMQSLFPAHGSKTFYIDWVAENGELLAHNASPVIEGLSNGQFEIPANYKGEVLHVRAYTKWMLNFDSALVYQKTIQVISKNPQLKKQVLPQAIPQLQFFPEGGELVAGVSNRLAFKANDQWGKPHKIKGILMEQGVSIDSIRMQHDGMGSLVFTPKPGAAYTAKWKDEKGSEHTTALPSINASGIALQVTEFDNKKHIAVHFSPRQEGQVKVNIIGTMQGIMIFKTAGIADPGGTVKKVIPLDNVPSGIMVITVFDEAWNALAERISFVKNDDHAFQTSLNVAHWGLNKRARNEIEISIPDHLEGANLSISITDVMIDKDSSSNIISHLFLNSELKGHIHNPSYYFKDRSVQTAQHLDLVMLTNGWRRFKWEDIAKGRLPVMKFAKDTNYLTLSGQLIGVPKSQLTGLESLVLFVKEKDSGAKMMVLPIDREGRFNDPDVIFFDTLKVYYQVKSKLFSSSSASFMTEKIAAPNYTSLKNEFARYYPFRFDTTIGYHRKFAAEALALQQKLKGNVLENVTVTAKTKPTLQVMDEKYASGLFSGGDSYQFDLVNDPTAMGRLDIFSYLTGRVAGLQISNTGSETNLSWRGSPPTLFLDERMADVDLISMVPIDDVAYIKVFRPPFIGAAGGGAGGAIAIYTKKGNDVVNRSNNRGGLSSNTITGYAPLKEFYSPNYNNFDKRHELKDVRTTLYWNPMLVAKPNKPLKIQFFNNDITTAFRIVIEGMSKEGYLTHLEEIME
jgi:hypothetical protein